MYGVGTVINDGCHTAWWAEKPHHYCAYCRSILLIHVVFIWRKGKGNVNLYSASSRTPLMHSYIDHTVLPANNTISAFTCKHSPGVSTTHMHSKSLSSTYYSFIDPKRMNGWVGHVGWHTVDGLPRGGHPSTACHGAGQGKFAGHRPTF